MSRAKRRNAVSTLPGIVADGSSYLESLRDGRVVIYQGEKVDVTRHPLFAPTAKVIAKIYDLIAQDPDLTYETETGARAFTPYLLPMNREDLARIRQAQEKVHRFHLGLILQGPEYKGPVISGLGAAGPYFAPYADNVASYYRYVRDLRLYPANAFTDPQVDRSKRPSELPNPDLVLRIVEERDDGVVIRGAKMVSTAAPFAHELLILRYGGANRLTMEDADYAFIGAVPINAPGLKLFPRKVHRTNVAHPLDAPFSYLFEETDAFLLFEDVFVPWERVFVYRDPEKADNWLAQTNLAVSLIFGDLVRWKTRFAITTALAVKVAKANGTLGFRGQQERLGEMLAWTHLMHDLVLAAEANPVPYYQGVMVNPETVLTYRALRPMIYKRFTDLAKEVAGSGAAIVPSSLKDYELFPELEEFTRGANLGGRERTKVFKAFWDLLHSDFAARSELSERLHTGNVSDVLVQLFFGAHGLEFDQYFDEAMGHVEALIREIWPDRPLLGPLEDRWSVSKGGEVKMKVVYLPALPLNSQMYEAQMQAVPGLGVDYPGFAGRPPREGMTLADYARDVLDQMDRAAIQRAVLVGTSLGAQLALYIAAHHPDRVEKLVLTATHALPPTPQEVEMFQGIAAAAEAHGPGALVDNFLQLLLSERTHREKPQVVEKVRQLILGATGQGMAQAFRALASRPDPRPWLGKVRVPTLILWGAEDRAVSPAHRGVLLRIGGSQLVMVPDAAHYPSLENPEAYTQALRAFLEG